ncbi:MAG: DUF362 domain-containing protein [Planctomycetaceae bacterium]|nr:DUF362 domain-containing protein [Planctomycetaceae bacterium]
MNRREFLKTVGLSAAGLAFAGKLTGGLAMAAADPSDATAAPGGKSTVYITRDISPAGLRKVYSRVNLPIRGKVAVKLHTGEPHGPNIVPAAWVKELLNDIPSATVVETNTFYNSPRRTTEGHRDVLRTNGWDFCPVDILDADGDVMLPVPGGKWLTEIAMGRNLTNYDSMLVLTHFKGHMMGGFGGSLKNIAIGCASGKVGKKQIHQDGDNMWGHSGERLMENIVESGKAVLTHFGPAMTYINVMRNMSVDCDCAGVGAEPVTTPDIGIIASTDIVAVDQASIDLLYALPAEQRRDLTERIESRHGMRQISYMEEMGMGSRRYDLVSVD